ncbi:MAG: prepilin peptidase [Lentisphaeria bacterium]|nr:prepilin peptidase [Lentisphaeria bacterium]
MLNLTGIYFFAYDWAFRAGLEYPAVLFSVLFAAFAFGACWGSFLNVCIWRMPRRESVVSAPSHCTSCGYDIKWYDNIPVVSYLVLRGKCRKCRTPYSCRYFVVEVVTGLAFVAIFLKAAAVNQTPQTVLLYWLAFWYLLGAAWIDAKHRIIPDDLTFPVLVISIILSGVFPEAVGQKVWWKGVVSALASAAAVSGFLYVFSLIGRKLAKGRDALGLGDVKLCGVLAVTIGIFGCCFSLFAASIAGIIYGTVLAVKRRRSIGRFAIPFAPFIAGGAVIWMFAGNWILEFFRHINHLQ